MLAILNSAAAGLADPPPIEPVSGGLPQLDASTYSGQIFWLLLSFGLLYLLLSRVFLPRLAAVLADRRDRIAIDLDAAAARRGEAEDASKAVDAEIADARARAHAIVAKEREALTAEIDAEAKSSEAALEARLAESAARIAARKDEALAHVRGVAAEAAGAVVQKLIGAVPSQSETEGAVDSVLAGRTLTGKTPAERGA